MNTTLSDIIKGNIVIVGIGNTLKGDDGLGPLLIAKLKKSVEIPCIDAGTAPENYTGVIKKNNPDIILLIDAVHMGHRPGEYAVLDKDEIAEYGLSTHDASPHLLIEYLEHETKAKVYMIGVQPEQVEFGMPVSEPVQKALDRIESALIELFKKTMARRG